MFEEIAFLIEKQVSINTIRKIITYDLCNIKNATYIYIQKYIIFISFLQGEQINNIEYFANKTTDNIDGGRVQLRKSEQKSRTYRKVYI